MADWPSMNDAAYHGVAGDVVRTISPHSEADPVAVLIQFLTCAGNIIGGSPFYQALGHPPPTEKLQKRARAPPGIALPTSSRLRTSDGTASAQRVACPPAKVSSTRYAIRFRQWNPKEKQFETLDPGIPPDGRGGDHCCLQALSKTKDNFVWEPIALQTNGMRPALSRLQLRPACMWPVSRLIHSLERLRL